ncbi:MAG: hypothetical protein SFT93_02860 [Rickettsiaceae bacterium]|nr:hypothetical protein [Rickettsiaceae bacterium]
MAKHKLLMQYYKVFNLIESKDKTNAVSSKDALLRLSKVKKVKIQNKWFLEK